MAGGEAGVQRVADLFAEEITSTMALLGRTSVAELDAQCLRLRD
jgi:L-lactate dehydrogenase (cytochrome)